jgi:hypothetical protein
MPEDADPKEVEAILRRVEPLLLREMQQALREITLIIENEAKQYPPARIESRYVRTGTLGGGWHTFVEPRGEGIEAFVGNAVRYAPFVQGPVGVQSRRMASYGWSSLDAMVEGRIGEMAERVGAAVERALQEAIGE